MSDSIYVQHICGYRYSEDIYEEKAARLTRGGFVRLRSKPRDDGLYWEIWYLSSPILAEGELTGKTRSDIVSWLMRKIGVGQIEEAPTSWGVSPD